MQASNSDILIFSDSEKVELLNSLKDKGQETPKDWQLIHSELCGHDEAEVEFKTILKGLSGHKFAVGIVSNPDLESFLDKGLIKIRYRYVVKPGNGRPIQSNTREFCEALIRANKIYRREDINIMSFRGANPIAKQNYSIFRLQGHWNCRHAWQREIYFLGSGAESVERSEIIEKKIVMSDNKTQETKTALESFTDFFKNLTAKLSKQDIVEINKVMLSEEQAFADMTDAEGRVMRIDGELAEGSAVVWISAEGEEIPVDNGEYSFPDAMKVITVKDGAIDTVTDAADAGEDSDNADPADTMMKDELNKFSENLDKKLNAMVTEAVENAIKSQKFASEEKVAELIQEELKAKFSEVTKSLESLPAFAGEDTSHSFSKIGEKETENVVSKIGTNLNGEFKRK